MTRAVDHLSATDDEPPAADDLMRQVKSALARAFRSTFGLG